MTVNVRALIAAVLFSAAASGTVAQERNPASWAYPVLDPGVKPPPEEGIKLTLPGSSASFTRAQLTDVFHADDWFPEAHPPMPDVVAYGRKPEVRACGVCHLPNGQGHPENAPLAGLPATYIVEQLADFRSGRRRSSVPSAGPQLRMVATAVNLTDEEAEAAAAYFSQQAFQPWIRVVESDVAPKVKVILGTMWAPTEEGGTEPIGRRIVEIPENLERAELRDPTSGFVAYVPVGSIKQGEALVTTGGGKTQPCAACHGPGLKGLAPAPPIAGRSPSYVVRQLYDFQSGTRAGANAALMKPVVAQLTLDDMIAIAAFVASRSP